jgi:enoyl-CoA hydratase/carnithine racemase
MLDEMHGALRLPELLGYRRAAETLFLGVGVNLTAAARRGLINNAIPSAELDTTVDQYIGRLRGLSGAALRLCKRAARMGADGWACSPAQASLYFEELTPTEEARDGVASFLVRASLWDGAQARQRLPRTLPPARQNTAGVVPRPGAPGGQGGIRLRLAEQY